MATLGLQMLPFTGAFLLNAHRHPLTSSALKQFHPSLCHLLLLPYPLQREKEEFMPEHMKEEERERGPKTIPNK